MTSLPNEQVLLRTGLHWGILLRPVVSALLMAVLLVALYWLMTTFLGQLGRSRPIPMNFPWLLMLLPLAAIGSQALICLVEYLKTEIVLTDQRLRFNTGLLALSTAEINLQKVETITVFESLLGRLIGWGTVTVIGTGGTPFVLHCVPEPRQFQQLLESAVRAAQSGGLTRRAEHLPPIYDETRYMPRA